MQLLVIAALQSSGDRLAMPRAKDAVAIARYELALERTTFVECVAASHAPAHREPDPP